MTTLEMIAEWRKGRSCAPSEAPEECPECTRALIDAIERDAQERAKSYVEFNRIISEQNLSLTDRLDVLQRRRRQSQLPDLPDTPLSLTVRFRDRPE